MPRTSNALALSKSSDEKILCHCLQKTINYHRSLSRSSRVSKVTNEEHKVFIKKLEQLKCRLQHSDDVKKAIEFTCGIMDQPTNEKEQTHMRGLYR